MTDNGNVTRALDEIRVRLKALEEFRNETERQLGLANGLREGVTHLLSALADRDKDLKADIEQLWAEQRRCHQIISDKLDEVQKPLWTVMGRIGLVTAIVMSLLAIILSATHVI